MLGLDSLGREASEPTSQLCYCALARILRKPCSSMSSIHLTVFGIFANKTFRRCVLVPHQHPSLLRQLIELPTMFYTFAHPQRAALLVTATCVTTDALPFSSNPSTANVDLRRELEESSFRKLPMQVPRGDLAAELYVTIACA